MLGMPTASDPTLNVRVTSEAYEHLAALSDRLGVTLSEVVRQFVAQGLLANPVDDSERRRTRERREALARGEIPGLVAPGGGRGSCA